MQDELILVIESDDELELVLDDSGSIDLVIDDGVAAPAYAGPYMVVPQLTDKVLNTDGKLMTDDVTVKEIPVTTTSNIYGGNTVVIG